MDTISVLLVDDHKIVREGIKAVLDLLPDIIVVGEAVNGKEGIRMAEAHTPDVILMDLIMPEMDGVMATRKVKSVSPNSSVIVLTSFYDDEHIFPAIQAGATSYLLKDLDPDELIDAIRKAAKGETMLNSRIASRVISRIGSQTESRQNPFAELSDREIEILLCIAEGQNNADIAETLVISQKTVKRHVTNILGKLHLADRTQAAVFAWRHGLMRSSE